MRTESTTSTIALVLLFISCGSTIVGCQEPGKTTSKTYGSVGWASTQSESVTPGIDHATVAWYLRDDRLAYLVWTDMNGESSSSGSSGSSSSGVEEHRTQLSSRSDEQMEFEWMLVTKGPAQSDTGVITLAGVEYDLKNGSLLLVSTAGGGAQVKQLEMPAAITELLCDKSESPRDALKAMAKDDASEIGSYFTEAAK
jgi:hypothetical protein